MRPPEPLGFVIGNTTVVDRPDNALGVNVGHWVVPHGPTAARVVDGVAPDFTVVLVLVAIAASGANEGEDRVSTDGVLNAAVAVGKLKEVLKGDIGRAWQRL